MTRHRAMWALILPAWDHAHRTANAGHATPAQRATLEAVLWLLASHQRLDDTVRLTQVAREAGLWDGAGECPRSASAAAGRHLAALAAMGAIDYEPSTSRRGCTITLLGPTVEELADEEAATRAPGTREPTDPLARLARANGRPLARTTRASDDPSSRASDDRSRASDAPLARLDPSTRAPGARASEGFRGSTEETPPRADASHGANGAGSAAGETVEVPAHLWHDPGPGDGELIDWALEHADPTTILTAHDDDGTAYHLTVDTDGIHFVNAPT
jgi:hypothetical protein